MRLSRFHFFLFTLTAISSFPECEPVDVCTSRLCSQICHPMTGNGTATCVCHKGFSLIDSTRCGLEPSLKGPLLLYTSGNEIQQQVNEHDETSAIWRKSFRESSTLGSFDMDISAATLYAISHPASERSTGSRVLHLITSGQPTETFYETKFGVLRDIGVDWITKNLYLIDADRNSIIACRTGNEVCVDIVTNIGSPLAFVLDPLEGRMFWVNSDVSSNPGIFQVSMDGSKSTLIAAGAGISSIAFDRFGNRLYWISSGKIHFLHLQFGTKGQLATNVTNGVALSVFGDTLYWSELSARFGTVRACDKLTGKDLPALVDPRRKLDSITSLRVVHPLMQELGNNPCHNSRCSHMCVIAAAGKKSCLCPKYYLLSSRSNSRCKLDEAYSMATSELLFLLPSALVADNDLSAYQTVTRQPNVAALASDAEGGALYALDNNGQPRILKIDLNNENRLEEVKTVSVSLVSSLTFDPLNRVLYWLDRLKKKVMIFNPSSRQTTAIDVQRNDLSAAPLDIAVEYYTGKIYVLNKRSTETVIDVYYPNGVLLQQLVNVSTKPTRITVDNSRSRVFIYDEAEKRIISLDGDHRDTVVEEVRPINQLEFWNGRLTWTELQQRGFFVPSTESKPQHITKASWKRATTAMTFTVKPPEGLRSSCSTPNAGCSHTCISTSSGPLCICPIGMVIGKDRKTCVPSAKAGCDAHGEFACANGYQCIPLSQKCDNTRHCDDDSDEQTALCDRARKNSAGCYETTFKCVSGADCKERLNDVNCPADSAACSPNMYKCADGKVPCSSGKLNCTETQKQNLMPESCAKQNNSIWCDGKCVFGQTVCDGYPNCSDGRDERNCALTSRAECSSDMFVCDNLKCVHPGNVCDNEDDCGDKSDEKEELCKHVKAKEEAEASCFAEEFKCADGSCIPSSKVCDSHSNCPDGSDEGHHCSRNDCASKPCQKHCLNTPEGFLCSCDEGFKLASDRVSCVDINECDSFGHCSHYCQNTKGSFKCFCGLGYKILTDNRTCALEANDQVLLFVADNQVRALSKRHRDLDVLFHDEGRLITGLTFDSNYETVYWSDEDSIFKLPVGALSAGAKPVVLATHMLSTSNLAFDWVAGHFYFVNRLQKIEACSLTMTFCTVLPTPPVQAIRSLALAANEGTMFFSHFASDVPNATYGAVYRSNMDGSNQVNIISTAILKPSYLQIDFIQRRLYVVDIQSGLIEHFTFDGTDRHVLLRGHQISAFTLLPDNIYWSEKDSIMKADWLRAASPQVLLSRTFAKHLDVMHRTRQPPGINSCARANCSQQCLLTQHGFACACDSLFNLAADNKTCNRQEEHADIEGLHADLCDPPCENGGKCIFQSARGFCECPRAFSGSHCEWVVGQSSSLLSICLTAVIIFIIVAVSIFGLTYMQTIKIPSTFKLTATYRANDMKNLLTSKNQGCEDEEELKQNQSSLSITNPLYVVDIEHNERDNGMTKLHPVPEENLLNL